MPMPEASKALAPPGAPSPCDQVSWFWAPVTPYPDPPSPPVTLSWPTDILEPHPRVSWPPTSCSSDPTGPSWPRASPLPPPVCSPQGPSPFPTTTSTEQGPRDRSAQRSALKAGTRPVSLWPPPPFARALPPVGPRPREGP